MNTITDGNEENFWTRFRDVTKPNPLWEEQALYGGYKWIRYDDTLWISRKYEYQLKFLESILEGTNVLSCNLSCIGELLNILRKQHKVPLAEENYTREFIEKSIPSGSTIKGVVETSQYKLGKIISYALRYPKVFILGNGPELYKYVAQCKAHGMKVYSDMGIYELPCTPISLDLMQQACVLINHEDLKYKEEVLNWSNILTV